MPEITHTHTHTHVHQYTVLLPDTIQSTHGIILLRHQQKN
jgi:hypothetical protein